MDCVLLLMFDLLRKQDMKHMLLGKNVFLRHVSMVRVYLRKNIISGKCSDGKVVEQFTDERAS